MNSRQLHRWITVVSILFIAIIGTTGIVLQFQQIFGSDEKEKERLSSLESRRPLSLSLDEDLRRVSAAKDLLARSSPDANIDRIEVNFKEPHPVAIFHLTSGQRHTRTALDLERTQVLKIEDDETESWILRLHTGEIAGDGGVFAGLISGICLIFLVITGGLIYLKMWRTRKAVKQSGALFWR